MQNRASRTDQNITEDDIFYSKVIKRSIYPLCAFLNTYFRSDEERKRQDNKTASYMASRKIRYSPVRYSKEDTEKTIISLSKQILECDLDPYEFEKAPRKIKMEKYRTVVENMANGTIQPDALQLIKEFSQLMKLI